MDRDFARSQRDGRVATVLESVIARRMGGEDLSDDVVLDTWPHLLPELSDRLRELRFVEDARRVAGSSGAGHARTHAALGAAQTPAASPPRIPGYDQFEPLQSGGQGIVYRAVQRSTGRTVAIKFIRGGPLSTARERQRFEREAQLLAQLRHPGIVTIHDSGWLDDCAYIVMDYIPGQGLDEFLAAAPEDSLSSPSAEPPRERVRDIVQLVQRIAAAVNAAHMRGIIHRDLKPGNIRIDPAGNPCILDFGLAKVAAGESSNAPAERNVTLDGQFVGSLAWASPEQADGRQDQVDVRTDVYALGLLLYHALTGRSPYPTTGTMREVLEHTVRTQPLRPRCVNVAIDDELETIILKCLAKERDRRYQSAGALSHDLECYLAGEPIAAKRDSSWYMLRTMVRRHRIAAMVAAGFLFVVIGGLFTVMAFWRSAEDQRVRAEQAEVTARLEARAAAQNADTAKREAERTRAANEYLREMVASVDPSAVGREVRVADMLDHAAGTIDDSFSDQPGVRATLHDTVGRAYQTLGLYEQAAPHMEAALELRRSALGNEHRDTLASLHALGVLNELRRKGEIIGLIRQAYETRLRLFGGDDPDTLQSMNYYGFLLRRHGSPSLADKLLTGALAGLTRVRGENHRETLDCLQNLAWLRRTEGRMEESAELFSEALARQTEALGEADPDTLSVRDHLSQVMRELGRFDESEALVRLNLQLRRHVHGDEHPETLRAISNCAVILHARGYLEESETLQREAIATWRRAFPDFPDVYFSLVNLANILIDRGAYGEAEEFARDALETCQRLNMEAIGHMMSRAAIGLALVERGELEAAHTVLCDAWTVAAPSAPSDRRRIVVQFALGTCLSRLGAADEAEPLLRQCFEEALKCRGLSQLNRRRATEEFAALLEQTDRPHEADEVRQRIGMSELEE